MKKFISTLMIAAVLSTSTGCFGEFQLVRGLWSWNDDVTDSRFVNNLLFYALNIIPVYGVAGMGDFIIFNLIEFWTGDNPLSMNEGEKDRQIIPLEGEEYIVEATKNQFKVYKEGGEATILRFDESDHSWNLIANGESQKLISLESTPQGDMHKVYTDNTVISLDANTNYDQTFLKALLLKNEEVAMK